MFPNRNGGSASLPMLPDSPGLQRRVFLFVAPLSSQRKYPRLGLAVKQTAEFKEVVTLLSKKKMTPKATEDYFCDVLQFDPKKADKKKDGEAQEPRMLPKFRAALTHAPGQELPSALGTAWGSFNAVTAVIDHETGRGDRSVALKNIWLGHQAGVKRRALDLAVELAK